MDIYENYDITLLLTYGPYLVLTWLQNHYFKNRIRPTLFMYTQCMTSQERKKK